jgi:hypothetical protein
VEIDLGLWEPEAFRQREGHDLMMMALLVGSSLMLALYTLVQGWSWRDRGFQWMTGWRCGARRYSRG